MKSDRPTSRSDVEKALEGTPYVALSPIGRGSMGEVWAIRHNYIGRDFALKILHRRHVSNYQLVERLRLEARAMAALEHPNIVEVTDFWMAADGRPCLAMELLIGQRLDRVLLEHKRLSGPEVVALGQQAASALAAAHQVGLIHRDIKPENIFLEEVTGSRWNVKLLDFGLARVLSGYVSRPALAPLDLTRTGALVGSPRFMSPEALRGERVDQSADIYSLGVVLYVCLVGLHSQFDIATTPAFHAPSRLGAIECSPQLDAMILRAVENDPSRRFPSARAFLEGLATCPESRMELVEQFGKG